MKDRIKKVMESCHLSQKAFAQRTNINEATLSGILNDKSKATLNTIDAIYRNIPGLSLEWLMYGKGPMRVSEKAASGSASDSHDDGANSSEITETTETGHSPSSSTLFSGDGAAHPAQGVRIIEKEVVKNADKPQRKITEIRVFFDDQTWESFVPKKS